MPPLAEIQKTREEKIAALRKNRIDPYPPTSARTHAIEEILQRFEALAQGKETVTLTGRITLKREHGGATFFHFRDGSGAMQAYAKKDVLGGEAYGEFLDFFDVGDFAEIEGTLFATKKGEKTIEAHRIRMLAKSLRPLPEKWHGLQDVEERYRKRYLDLVMNAGVRERFAARSRLTGLLRDFFLQNSFTEVETPILHTIPGGALAKPFKTRLAALDLDLYLRVAPELYLKRLLVGGFDAIFEIGRCFRNEGMDKEHNPEFTMLEAYASYRDYEWLMALTEHLFVHVVKEGLRQDHLRVAFAEAELDFTTPWQRVEFNETLKIHAGLDFWENSEEDFKKKVQELGLTVEKSPTKAALADELFKKVVRPKMLNPVFVINHPVELSPLAKNHRDDSRKVERFQLLAGGMEIANAFTELNDPTEQRRRFLQQEKERGRGDEEAMRLDEDFIEALEYGMPPAAGIGIGIDRLVRLLTNAPSLREVIAFPTMRPRS